MQDRPSRALVASGRLFSIVAVTLGSVTVALVCLGTFAHVDVFFHGAAAWDVGAFSLVIAEVAAAARGLLWLRARLHMPVRRALASVGIALAVVSGATAVTGYIGHRATYTTVASSCHGHPAITARETDTLLRARGALYERYGVILIRAPESEYRPSLGVQPAAEGYYTSTCHRDGSVTITFPTSGYAPPIPAITIRER
ncbi:hypothetical protein [Frondihabitans peucedani]|uniref:Uncharacterized protein n=1 Tax=Frondihabitans peucedani TaxID=598626 RepID=A0ABP8E693_9MICO